MPHTPTLALLLAIAAAPAWGQLPCTARVRELAVISPREALGAVRARGASTADIIADGTSCEHVDRLSSRIRLPGTQQWLTVQPALVRLEYVGGVPDQRSSDGVWAGLGANIFLRAGVGFDYGRFHAVFAPEAAYTQNRVFAFFPNTDSSRFAFNSNWYHPPYSIDLPTRYGARPITQFGLGQSAAWASVGPADAGVSTSSQAWGPGVRGHLLLGPDAPGIPRIFARTHQPVVTPIGAWSGTAFFGVLTESPFFDADPSNDLRTLIAWNAAWSPSETSGTVIVFANETMQEGTVFGLSGPQMGRPTDQMNSLYARVTVPEDGLRAWVEIARSGALPSLRQFLTIPYQGISYLIGMERAIPLRNATLLVSGEVADLEQFTDIRGAPTQDFYTSRDIAQGWTQRGRILGDGIGPGGQSQWLALDWIASSFTAGLFAERVRWNEDAFTRQYLPNLDRNDVSLRWGLRGSGRLAGQRVHLELSAGKRLNYLFQNGSRTPGLATVDVSLAKLRFWITPFSPRNP
jgi:hypothetical protein